MGLLLLMGGNTINLTEAQFEALNEYDLNATYSVAGVGVFMGSTLSIHPPFDYAVGDLHVSKSGNDTTGDGSFANPYLTIDKAISVADSAGGITIWVEAGTYAENTSSLGHLGLSGRVYTEPLKIRSRPGEEVILTNASGTTGMRFYTTCSNIIFQGLKIRAAAGSTIVVRTSTTHSNIEFRDCDFTDAHSNTSCFTIAASSNNTNWKVKRCKFESGGPYYCYFNRLDGLTFIGNEITSSTTASDSIVRLGLASGTCHINSNVISTPSVNTGSEQIHHETAATAALTLNVNGNRITTAGRGISITGGTSGNESVVYCDRNTIISGERGIELIGAVNGGSCSYNTVNAGGPVGIGWPTDSSVLSVVGATVSGNHIVSTGATGHALLIGINGSEIEACNNLCDARPGGRYGIVIKGDSHVLRNNVFYSGSTEGVYFKGATNCEFVSNVIAGEIANSVAFAFALNDTTESSNNTITDNEFNLTNGKLYDFTGLTIGDGNVIDRNVYHVSGSAAWGSMFGSTVNSLSDVRASWAANYDVTTNDANSTSG